MVHFFEDDPRVCLKESSIENAGLGLFARRNLREGEMFVYWGKILNRAEGKKIDKSLSDYVYQTEDGIYIDAKKSHNCPARWLNDGGISGHVDNCEFLEGVHPKFPVIVTTRDVLRGEELFVSYGKSYWADYK